MAAIVRLWDDEAFYKEQSEKARRQAERWQPEQLRPLYAGFFGNVRPQADPPPGVVGDSADPSLKGMFGSLKIRRSGRRGD